MGAQPVPQEEVTVDQLTAIKALLDEGHLSMWTWRSGGLMGYWRWMVTQCLWPSRERSDLGVREESKTVGKW
eukprot:5138985-Amphidinium_carterae.2